MRQPLEDAHRPPRPALLWLLVATAATLSLATAESICSSCSIYILDLSSFANGADFPVCDLDKVVTVNPDNGVVYLEDTKIARKVSHKFGTHSAPWYLYKAIQNSNCVTDDIEKASVVFVYDYCYYIWWLAHVHSLGRDRRDTPGDHLIKGWTAMLNLPRWKLNGGRDFVFYDSHPGFVAGHSAPTFVGMFCNEFRHATHIVVERAQRNVCQSYLEISKLLITPYVPNVVDTANPLATVQRPSNPKAKRDILVYFRGRCTPYKGDNVGKKLRYATVQALENSGNDTDIHCSESEFGHPHEDFALMLDKMERSVFCLVLAGDAQSTRRLSEIFMAGCIPVFVGPPYNSMPLAEDVHYKSIGVFFNISNYKSWLPERMEWQIHATERAAYAQEARWWIPDADVSEVLIPVDTLSDMMGHLREMPDSEVRRKLTEMETERHRFTFQEHMAQPPVEPPNTLNSILSFVCKQAHRQQQHRHHHAQKAAAAAAETQPQLQQQQAQLQQQAQPQQAKGRGAKLPSAVLPVKPAKGSRKPVLMSTASMPIQEATDPYDYEEAD